MFPSTNFIGMGLIICSIIIDLLIMNIVGGKIKVFGMVGIVRIIDLSSMCSDEQTQYYITQTKDTGTFM